MNIAIEKDADFADVQVTSKSTPNERFRISRPEENGHDGLQMSFPAEGKSKLSLETEGVDLLINDKSQSRHESRPDDSHHWNVSKRDSAVEHADDDRRSVYSADRDPEIVIKETHDQDGDSVTDIRFGHPPESPRHHHYPESPKYGRDASPKFGFGFAPDRRHDDDWRDRQYDTRSEVSVPAAPKYTPEELHRHKRQILFHLDRLEKKGVYIPTKFTMESDLEEMRGEYERLKQQSDTDKAIKFYQNMLMAFVSGAEFLNENYSPYKLKLDGWSENVIEKIEDYDDVFEELHIKYATKMKLPPEMRLLGMVVGSGFMTHLTNSVFKSSSLPNFGDVMKNNPDLMRQFQAASVNTATQQNPAMGGIFGMMNQMGANIPTPPHQDAEVPFKAAPQFRPEPANTGSIPAPVQRREMRGPSNVDDILKSFAPKPNNVAQNDDVKSVNLSELNDQDRISEISSIDEADLHKARNVTSRPVIGVRPTHRDAFISRIKTRKRSNKKDGGLIIDI